MAIVIKHPHEVAALRAAGRVNALALQAVAQAARPGITTAELDRVARRVMRAHNATPVFLGYPAQEPDAPPYPGAITVSIDDELVHGIPSSKRTLRAGQIVSIDCGVRLNGWVGDSAITLAIGQASPAVQHLVAATHRALELAIALCRVGNRLGDVSAAIEEWVESQGLHVAREYTGHGVGREMHEEPTIYNWGTPGRGAALRPGMVLAIEPMVIAGSPELYVKPDGWTVATVDGSLCAHFEHTVAITEGEPEILTLP